MRSLLLIASCTLYACTPSANNTTSAPETKDPEQGEIKKEEPTKPTDPEIELQLKGCTDSTGAGSDHQLKVQRDPSTGKITFDFENLVDRNLRVISLYVTGMNDDIPTFENGFKFTGTAYWMVSLDDPFETSFQLPMVYGNLPDIAVDVTENYKGKAGGIKLADLKEASCLKTTVVTFEPEQVQSFKTSSFLQIYRP